MISEIELKRLNAYQETDPDKLREMLLAEIQAHQEAKEELEFQIELLTEEYLVDMLLSEYTVLMDPDG